MLSKMVIVKGNGIDAQDGKVALIFLSGTDNSTG